MKLGKYSFGTGDRFNHQGEAQLRAIMKAASKGLDITPVWNKSNREHNIVHSEPEGTRTEADTAVKALGWNKPYFVDADHINLSNVDRFVEHADFFTIDVASFIGKKAAPDEVAAFMESCAALGDEVAIDGISDPIVINEKVLEKVAGSYLAAVKEAGRIYRHIESIKGTGRFITEISMDEVDKPQTPIDMFFILKMIAGEKIPVQTIAPKFTGRFNKGVDYEGDVSKFAIEFEQDVLVISHAVKAFNLPAGLKLSVHSGSDKFSIYPVIADIIKKHNVGIHVKTAGTTWIEEVIGLAISGVEGLVVAKDIYRKAFERKEELCAPYADVISIKDSNLPLPKELAGWTGEKFAGTLRHIPGHPDYNPDFRQLIHVGYKVASEMGLGYLKLLEKYAQVIGGCVEENIYDRHLKRLFNL